MKIRRSQTFIIWPLFLLFLFFYQCGRMFFPLAYLQAIDQRVTLVTLEDCYSASYVTPQITDPWPRLKIFKTSVYSAHFEDHLIACSSVFVH